MRVYTWIWIWIWKGRRWESSYIHVHHAHSIAQRSTACLLARSPNLNSVQDTINPASASSVQQRSAGDFSTSADPRPPESSPILPPRFPQDQTFSITRFTLLLCRCPISCSTIVATNPACLSTTFSPFSAFRRPWISAGTPPNPTVPAEADRLGRGGLGVVARASMPPAPEGRLDRLAPLLGLRFDMGGFPAACTARSNPGPLFGVVGLALGLARLGELAFDSE